jgi:lysyl-tRNA synthetase class 2
MFQGLHNYEKVPAELFDNLDLGDIIGVSGKLIRTRTGEATVRVDRFDLLAKSLRSLPEKWHGLADVDTRYRQRHLDLIANEKTRQTFRTRSRVVAAVRRFMDGLGFLEAETAVMLPAAGGALATPFVSHYNALDQDVYLRIATELHLKRLIIGGLDRVYEIGRVFRNEGVSTKHSPEYTLLESYQAYADYEDVMRMVEEMVSSVSQEVLGSLQIPWGDETIDLTPPWRRLDFRQAIAEHSGIAIDDYPDVDSLAARMRENSIEVDPKKNWGHLVDQLLSDFVEPKLRQPTFLVDYPLAMSPLAKTKPDDPAVVERFEAFAGGFEIANAYTELNDPQEQRERFRGQLSERVPDGEEVESVDDDFLEALEYGMPPTGGLGIGIDRLVMLLTDQHSIREVILFPMLKNKP